MANTHTTPFVKRMRTQGGTIYTFSSATEDIGLNINERNNIVKMSHYALLNIPSIEAPTSSDQNKFNAFAIPGALKSWDDSGSIKDGRVVIAESFQNYALNLEANLLDLSTYNAELPITVSERVFWKWLKETGAIRWVADVSNGGQYWKEPSTAGSAYGSVVKAIGQISAGAARNGTHGTYNETYILVPTSFGQTDAFFKQIEDDNYKHGMTIPATPYSYNQILGRGSYAKPHPDGLDLTAYYDAIDVSSHVNLYDMKYYNDSIASPTYAAGWWYTYEGITSPTAKSYYTDVNNLDVAFPAKFDVSLRYVNTTLGATIDFKRSKLDCVALELNLDNLKNLYSDSALTFDKLAIENAISDRYEFNAVLLYYSVKNKTNDTVLATNLLGVLFLDPPSGNTSAYPSASSIVLPSITKLQSGTTGFGTSYSFRLNVKSDYMLDDTVSIITDTTSSQIVLEDFAQVFEGLSESLTILNQHTGTINYITNQYLDISSTQTDIVNDIADLQYQVNDLSRDITGTENAIPMFIAGQDPLGDSSIFMYQGKIGFFNNQPTFAVQVDGSVKVKDLYIENAIRDSSGHLLLGYGSPLQLGSSTNYREMAMYTGNQIPAITVDISNNINFNGFRFSPMIRDTSLGLGFSWGAGGLLQVDVSTIAGGVTASYVDGSLNKKADMTFVVAYVDGSLATLNASINTTLNASVNTALGAYATNSSVNNAFLTNTSLGTLTTRQIYIDASLGRTSKLTYALNSSIGAYTTNASVAKFATNASVNAALASYIPSASLGTGFTWNAGVLDVSGGGGTGDVTKAYVDASLLVRDTSINSKVNRSGDTMTGSLTVDASITIKNAKFYILDKNNEVSFEINDPSLAAANNTFFGKGTGSINSDGFGNTFVGVQCGSANISGYNNTFLGLWAGKTSNANENTFIGVAAGYSTTTGGANTFIGKEAGFWNTTGDSNVALGYSANKSITTGIKNTAIGTNAGYDNVTGSNNVFIGNGAGEHELGSNKLYIANSDVSVLISGDFVAQTLSLNAQTDLNNKRITGVATPINPSDAVNMWYVDASFNKSIYLANASLGTGLTWSGGYLYVDVSILADGVTYAYVDGSLNAKANTTYVDSTFTTNVSFNELTTRHNVTETSLGTLTTKVNNIDVCLGTTSIIAQATNASSANFATNASVNNAFLTNVSLGTLTTKVNYIDACLGVTSVLTYAMSYTFGSFTTNASVAKFATNASVNTALETYIKNTSTGVGLYWNAGLLDVSVVGGGSQAYVDGSLATLNASVNTALQYYIPSTSLGTEFTWGGGILHVDVSTVAGGATIAYVDGSLALKASITYVDSTFATNSSVNLAFASNASLGTLTTKVNYIDASLGRTSTLTYALNSSIGAFATNSSVNLAFASNASLGTLTTKVNYIDASLGRTSTLAYALNASISAYATNASVNLAFVSNVSLGTLTTKVNYIDASLGRTSTLTYALNASISAYATNSSVNNAFLTNSSLGNLTSKVNYIDACLGNLVTRHNVTESSLGTLTTRVNNNDTSINWLNANKQTLGDYIKSASIGTTLYWNSGVFDVSLSGTYTTLAYVDGSFANKQSQINSLSGRVSILESEPPTGVTYAYVNASLALRDTSLNVIFNKHNVTESSLGTLTSRYNIAESSLGTLTSRYNIAESSLGTLTTRHNITESSLGSLTSTYNITESSLGTLTTRHNITESSLGSLASTVDIHSGTLITINSQINSDILPHLSLIDTSILYIKNAYTTNASMATAKYVKEASLGSSFVWTSGVLGVDVSVVAGGVTQTYVDGSLSNIRAAYIPNASLNTSYFKWITGVLEPSIVAVSQLTLLTDVSIVGLANNDYLRYNSSIGKWVNESTIEASSYFYTKTQIDASFALITSLSAYATNASTSLALAQYIKSASLGTGLYWNAGLLDVSVIGGSGVSSLSALTDVSIVSLSNNNLLKYDSSWGKWMNVAPLDASTYFYTKTESDGFYVKNASLSPSYFNWNAGYLEASAAGGSGTSQAYVDGSLSVRDGSITALFAKTAQQDASISNVASLYSYVNSSSYVDGSLNNIRAIYIPNSSFNQSTFKWVAGYLEPSVAGGVGDVTKAYVDGSISTLNASVNLAFSAINASLNDVLYLSSYVDSSSYIRANFVANASLSPSYFNWNAGYLEASAAGGSGISQAYVDASLAVRDGSITALFAITNQQEASINNAASITSYVNTSTYYDGSLNNIRAIYIPNSSLNTSYFKWVANLLEPSVAGGSGDVTKAYVDASLAVRDGSITALFAKTAQQDASLNSSFNLASYVDSSSYIRANFVANASLSPSYFNWNAGILEASVAGGVSDVTKAYVDGSLSVRDGSITALFAKTAQQDASINSVGSIAVYVNSSSYYDASLNNIRAAYIPNSSLNTSYFKWVANLLEPSVAGGSGDVTKAYVDASLAVRDGSITALFAKTAQQDASLNDIWSIESYIESSSYIRANFVANASLSPSYFNWNAGMLEASVASGSGVSQAYVDGSLSALNASVNLALSSFTSNTSTLAALTDVSIVSIADNNLLKYDSSWGKWRNVAPIDASSYFYTKTQIDASFALNASLNLAFDAYATNASVNLAFASNASLGTLTIRQAYIDASLSRTSIIAYATNVSIGLINASLNDTLSLASYVESSTYNKAIYIADASLNQSKFKWIAGILEPSVASSGDTTIIEASLYTLTLRHNVTEVSLGAINASLNSTFNLASYVNSSSYYDGSLNKINASLNDIWPIASYVNSSSYYDGSLNSLRTLLPSSKTFQTLEVISSSIGWNITSGYNAKVILTSNASLNMINASSGDSGTLIVMQDGSGGRLINLPATSLKNGSWVLSDASNARDIISFLYDGSNYYWNKGGSYV